MIDYAKAHGFLIAGVTSEHGSGLDFSRDGIKAVSHAIEMGEADALLVKELSRLGRDVEETDVYLHWLKKHNVTLICADGTEPQTYADVLHRLIGEFGHSLETRV
nr:recombinase family protein [uncultured Acetatifactor sp.]